MLYDEYHKQKNVVLELNRVPVRPLSVTRLSVIRYMLESQLQTSLQLSDKLSLILS